MRTVVALLLSAAMSANAGEVEVLHVRLIETASGTWEARVTLRHADTGWDHYADAWRVVGPDGAVLGTRTLYHPHVAEQPFTRRLGGIVLPEEEPGAVEIEAHDNVHGWSPNRLRVPLSAGVSERYEVVRRAR